MSINILMSPGASSTSSQLPNVKSAIDIAKAGGYYGIRIPAGTNNYGNNAQGDTSVILEVLNYAFSTTTGGGPLSVVSILLNINPKFNGTTIVSLNNGTYLHQPNLPLTTGVWDWLVTWWQKCVTDSRDWCIAHSLDPTQVLEFEWANETNVGGVQGPYDVNASGVNIGYVTYPSGTYPNGTIIPKALEAVDYIQSRVNWHGIPTLGWNFEGEQGSPGTAEVNSYTGSHATSIRNSCDTLGTNCYAAAVATPYSSVNTKAAFNSKVQANLVRLAANSIISGKPIKLREFGIDLNRCPSCTAPNTVRQDLVDEVHSAMGGITEGNFFCCYNTGGATSTNAKFCAYDVLTGLPIDNIAVEVS